MFCALNTTNRFRCQLNGQGGANPELRSQFSQGWQWFIDSNPDKQYNLDGDTLLGNTIEVKDQNIYASTLNSEAIIALNAITFSNGEIRLISTVGEAITPTVTFSKNNGKTSAVIFNETGRTTFSPQYSIGSGPQGAASGSGTGGSS